jgi:tetratricopeptide (TPR) repeat protein
MSAAAGIALLALALQSGAPAGPSASLDEWRELAELELYGELLAQGTAAEPGGPLAAEGEAAALLARALHETRGAELARAWLDEAEPRASPATRPLIALERVRLWIEEDELDAALAALAPRAHEGDGAGGPAEAPGLAPERPESWLYLGRVHARRGDPERARAPLERFLALAPRHPEAPAAHYALSQDALRRGDGAAARAHAARAAEIGEWQAYVRVRRLQSRESPGDPLPRLGLAMAWMAGGELERAEGVLRDLLDRFPEHAPAWFHLGEVRRLRADLPGARECYDRALSLDPDQHLARYNRAVIARLEGRPEEARADFALLVEGPRDDPRLLGAHLELARLLLAAGEAEAAEARYAEYRARGGAEALGP